MLSNVKCLVAVAHYNSCMWFLLLILLAQVRRFGQVSSPEDQGALQFPRPNAGSQRGGLDHQQHPRRQRSVIPAEVCHSSGLCCQCGELEGEAILWHGGVHPDCLPATPAAAWIQDRLPPKRTEEPLPLFGGGQDVSAISLNRWWHTECVRI